MRANTWMRCPYCLTALIGAVVLLAIPGLAGSVTPIGAPWIGLLLIPIGSALLRRLLTSPRCA
ncbi:MAG: hypothetical protein COS34_07660 [Lysobacterales bacterium CG02_land_8_20_14_3_00_62_12]|nr:MAG: hypothetical protein COS34_07660 [Xanthomonadales bacterium CG02_land_8_20_14_3_00_62_12]PJA38235.1 MAG: hypothetical protein CO182_10855 [Xanthomonadales bacterium CG_4_9_14_3_um_filter_62_6]